MPTLNRILSPLVCACALAAAAQAQAQGGTRRGPSEPARPFVVMPAQSLSDLERRLRPGAGGEDLHGGPGTQLRVAVQHERDRPAAEAEVHDASDDVYYVLEGTATLTLGGRLESPVEREPGEWRGPRISGGRTVDIKKGDLVIVPRGTPHARSTAGKEFSMILLKVWAEPLPAPPPAPSAAAPAEGPFTAVVGRDEARFTLPVAPRPEWRWRLPETAPNAREYRMDVSLRNAGREYTFGYYLWKRAGASPGSGSLAELIEAGQESLFERPRPGLFGLVGDSGVSAKAEGGRLVIKVRGRKNVERLFSGRPPEVTFKIEVPGATPVSKTVAVNYEDRKD